MNLVGGPGTSLVSLSGYTASGIQLLNGTVYWVYVEPAPGGGVPLALLRQSVPSIAHAQNNQLIPVDLMRADTTEPAVGITAPTIRINKNGAGWTTCSDGAWDQCGYGLYTVRFDETDSGELGWVMMRVKHASTAETHVMIEVSVSPAERRADYLRGRAVHRSTR